MNCAKCGKEIQDGILCVDCVQAELARVNAAPAPVAATQYPAPQPLPKKRKWPKVLAIVLSVVLLLGIAAGAAYWYFFMREDNTAVVEETLERFCTSIEEMDVRALLNCVITDDTMETLDTYVALSDVSYDDLREDLMDSMQDSLGGESLADMDIRYEMLSEPVEVEGEEYDSIAKTLTMMLATGVDKILEADVDMILAAGGEEEHAPVTLYFYRVEDKWYLLPGDDLEGSAFGADLFG